MEEILFTTNYATLNYPFLLITHLVCADGQIHIEETRFLQILLDKLKVNDDTKEEMNKILSQNEKCITLEDAASFISLKDRDETLKLLMFMTYADGFCDPLEREFLEKVLKVWRIPVKRLDQLCMEAEEKVNRKNQFKEQSQEKVKLSFSAQIVRGMDSILSRTVVDALACVASKDIKETAQRLRREVLLAGPDYDNAINICSQVSKEDMIFTERSLEEVWSNLHNLISSLTMGIRHIEQETNRSGAKSAKEVITQLKKDQENLERTIIHNLENVRKSLYKKRRAMNYFTLSFMGKSKAGKSTLHAVITGEGWDAIGIGKQRTTKYNRVYEWKNIRIIDTPGIGAPGEGRRDEEIAKTIIDETDVMCFVLTNNNQQNTELNFLKLLKEKAKPFIILFNIQENLQHPTKLKRFLENPNKVFSVEDKTEFGGHLDRIRSYAKKFYENDYFEIVPVQLFAAQLSRQSEDQKQKDLLYRVSRIDDFLNRVRVSLINDGAIRRSQTLLGCTVGDIEESEKWVREQAQSYLKFADELRERSRKALNHIDHEGIKALNKLETSVKRIFQDLIDSVQDFAEDYWESNEDDLNNAWKMHVKKKKIDDRIQKAYKEATEDYSKNIQYILEEMGREIELVAKLEGFSFGLSGQDTDTSMKSIFRWGGLLVGIAGTIIGFFSGIGIIAGALTIVGSIINWISGWFTSREEKRRKAVAKISESLISQISPQEKKVLDNCLPEFSKQQALLKKEVNGYFGCLIHGLRSIGSEMKSTNEQITELKRILNKAYAKRVLDWCEGKIESLNQRNINSVIYDVKRSLGKSMEIYTKRKVLLKKKNQKERENVLQENVQFIRAKS